MLPLSYRLEKAGSVFRPHGHESEWSRFGNTLFAHIQDGRCLLETEAGESLEIGENGSCCIPVGVWHRLSVTSERGATVLMSYIHCRVYEFHGLFTVLDEVIVFDRRNSSAIGKQIRALLALQKQGAKLRQSVQASSFISTMVGIAVESCPRIGEAWDDPDRRRLLPVVRHIQNHMRGPLRRVDIANAAGLSESHLHTLFMRVFGCAPMKMVRRERMQKARQLLHWTELPIAEVAWQSGFADPYYFSRAFRAHEGMPPREYRRLARRAGG